MKRFRVGMLRISQETNAFSPFSSSIEAFRHYRRGEDLMRATARWGREVEGAMRAAELSGFRQAIEKHGEERIEVVPIFSAWAFPSGPLSTEAIEHFSRDLRETIEAAGPLDAMFFCMHGALRGDDGVRPEVIWLKLIREYIGDGPIAVTVDLHAHITQALIDPIDIFCAYRTNPHRDHKNTGYRAGKLLVQTLFGEIQPTIAWRTLPMVQGGGATLDFLPPVRSLFRTLTAMERADDVLDASLLMVHLWLRDPDLGWSVVVTTDANPSKAERLAEQLADLAWAKRKTLPPRFPGPEEALQQVRDAGLRRRFGTVCICDASDVVGAGAPGTNTALLRILLEQGQDLLSYCAIRDQRAVEALWHEPIGASIRIHLGGHEPDASPAIEVAGKILNKEDDLLIGQIVALDLGHVQLVVTAGPPIVMKPVFYKKHGLRPSKADICVVKNLFPFRLFFGLHNRKTIYVTTRGATDFDRGAQQDFSQPTWPQDDPSDWRPADRARRS